ncbi:hypothetical protein [Ligilactobacillus ceti]|uniref:Uncharacterized protein n=1 Tax=Ligilactobacillus ceti DSM 22408 TaxID=1122146 RepID=A0A0R2KKS2_9LACO|nr:hypothetical protein [Ligilactobacillus ceti]KRN89993.1 hypothetical protein IV53_GL001111 [Ligilactobacillus ceti DSM 22408]
MKSQEVFDLIEEIICNDGTSYYEISNMVQNGRAELAANRGFIKDVRIIQLNIPHSGNVMKYEEYINQTYTMPEEDFTEFERWERTPEIEEIVKNILKENKIA